MPCPILQFGTSRFLQAHADLFFAQAGLRRCVAVVQTTTSGASAKRLEYFNRAQSYRVHVLGLHNGARIDRWDEVDSIGRGIDANADWAGLEDAFVHDAQWILSNTGDRGYELYEDDALQGAVPRAFPAKLTKLLYARFRAHGCGLTLFPCELIPGNGDVLQQIVLERAAQWRLESRFADWLRRECLWINSLVDRIVSEPLEPAGAVAEPYALWAVEKRPGLIMPGEHASIVLTDDLKRYERLKLFILNLGHTWLAEGWAARGADTTMTVRVLLDDPTVLADLNGLYDAEVLPVFAALGLNVEAAAYRASVIERFRNPFLNHYLADIHTNHQAKAHRRFGGVIELAEGLGLGLAQARLRRALRG